MYLIQSKTGDVKTLSCGFKRIDITELERECDGALFKELVTEKNRINYLYENKIENVYTQTRKQIIKDKAIPPICKGRAAQKLLECMQYMPNLEFTSFVDVCAGPGAMSDIILKSCECSGVGITLNQEDTSKDFYDFLKTHPKYTIISYDDGDITRQEVRADVSAAIDAIFGERNTELVVCDGAPSLSFEDENFQEILSPENIDIGTYNCIGLRCVTREYHHKIV